MKLLFRASLFLFVLFIPTQLAYHFWPDWSLLFGIRVDYLSPTLYFSGFLFAILFATWIYTGGFSVLLKLVIKNKIFVILILLFVALNIMGSNLEAAAIIKWLKYLEMFLVALVFKDRVSIKELTLPLSFGIFVVSLIGISQFVYGKSLDGVFYWVGERMISLSTPGVSTLTIFGEERLRPYSTFSHPNSLSGYLVVVILIIAPFLRAGYYKIISIILGVTTLFLAYSKGALLSAGFITLLYGYGNKILNNQKIYYTIFLSVIVISLLSLFLVQGLADTVFPKSVTERINHIYVSKSLISENIIFGVGANNYVASVAKNHFIADRVWDFQPVHNLFLLVLAESGIIGLLIFIRILYKSFSVAIENSKTFLVLSFLVILITGSLDHYWLTLQQNLLLFSMVIGQSLKEKNE